MNAIICDNCSKEVRLEKRGSLTQWIFGESSCSCNRPVLKLPADKTKNICTKCFNFKVSRRSGSITQWIFRRSQCKCSSDAVDETTEISSNDNRKQEPEAEQDFGSSVMPFPVERYKPLRIIATSENSVVYKCFDCHLGRVVAIKTLIFADQTMLIRFQQEARATGQLKHSNIVEVLDFGLGAGGAAYMVLEFIDATNLDDWLQTHGPFSETDAIRMIAGVCRALDFAHKKGIHHRDLKPQNILISENREPKLIDFGLALVRNPEQNISNTQGLSLAGTPSYMSPDQFLGRPYDSRSEIYSLGCVLFACLTGVPPFHGDTPLSLAKQHAEAEVPALQKVNPGRQVSQKLENVVKRCLEKKPEDRYSSISELANDLQIDLKSATQGSSKTEDQSALTEDNPISSLTTSRSASTDDTTSSITKKIVPWGIGCGIAAILLFGGTAFNLLFPSPEKLPKISDASEAPPKDLMDLVVDETWITRYGTSTAHIGVSDEDFKILADDPRSKETSAVLVQQSNISGTGIHYLKGMPIERIKIVSKNFSDQALDSLRLLPKLRDLQIGSSEKITVDGIKKIADSKVDILKLLNMRIPEGGLAVLSKKPDLIALYLKNESTDEFEADFKPIASMHNLNFLEIKGFNFNDDDIINLRSLKKLTSLTLSNLDISDTNLEILQTLPKLEDLNLSGTKITNAGLKKLGKIKSLNKLTLFDCPKLGKASVVAFRTAHPSVYVRFGDEGKDLFKKEDIAPKLYQSNN